MKKTVIVLIILCSTIISVCAQIKEIEGGINMENENKKGLTVGDKIPEILGKNEKGEIVKASDFKGKKLVLYFYPKDSTPGCTAEACSFRDNYDRLLAQGYAVLGVSADSEASHKKFIEKQNLPFSLIADEDKKLNQEFGVWGEKSLAGRKYMGIFRTTFLVDENGVIKEVISPKEIKTKEHALQILNK